MLGRLRHDLGRGDRQSEAEGEKKNNRLIMQDLSERGTSVRPVPDSLWRFPAAGRRAAAQGRQQQAAPRARRHRLAHEPREHNAPARAAGIAQRLRRGFSRRVEQPDRGVVRLGANAGADAAGARHFETEQNRCAGRKRHRLTHAFADRRHRACSQFQRAGQRTVGRRIKAKLRVPGCDVAMKLAGGYNIGPTDASPCFSARITGALVRAWRSTGASCFNAKRMAGPSSATLCGVAIAVDGAAGQGDVASLPSQAATRPAWCSRTRSPGPGRTSDAPRRTAPESGHEGRRPAADSQLVAHLGVNPQGERAGSPEEAFHDRAGGERGVAFQGARERLAAAALSPMLTIRASVQSPSASRFDARSPVQKTTSGCRRR